VFARSDYQDGADHQAPAVFICNRNSADEFHIRALTSVNSMGVNSVGIQSLTPADLSLKRGQTFYINH